MARSGLLGYVLIAVGALLLFVPGLGAVHLFDWDEINFAEIAREMLVTGDWLQPQIDHRPFHEKPPLFMWMQAICMSVFGIGEFAARVPNAIAGLFTLLALYRIGSNLRDGTFGMLWVLAYVGSLLPHLYFRSGIIDPWFNLFIFLGLHHLIEASARDALARHGWLSGFYLGLAVLTKGPVGLLIPGLVVLAYTAFNGFRIPIGWLTIGRTAAGIAFVVGSWLVVDVVRHGPVFIEDFFWRQVAMLTTEDAGHGGFFGYHFVVLLVGCFPASLFAIRQLLRPERESARLNDHRRWMVLLFWVVLILFSIVRTKIVHYSSLAYFPLTYLAALTLESIWKRGSTAGTWTRIGIGVVGGILALVFTLLPVIGNNLYIIRPLFAQDAFALGNLDAEVTWSGSEALAGLWLGLTVASALFWLDGKDRRWGILTLFGGMALFIPLALMLTINKIEGYSQRAAIDFFKERQGERCYVITMGYKSYAHLFYTRKPPVEDPRAYDEEWLLHGSIDRPVYVVSKITSVEEVKRIGTLQVLGTKNGFVFWQRPVPR
ncbi:MAG: glycosyltransferase family 39 protein [Flavobacteriales bacterium]|nr:glycosyltransferase family 39 protein [Flavobacteriales bacterium]